MPALSEKMDDIKGLDDEESSTINLVSNDKEKFTVPREVAIGSELVKTMAEGDAEADDIDLPNVTAPVLKMVVAYLTHHAGSPAKAIDKPLKSSDMAEVVGPWDANFVDVDQELLFELTLAANYMHIDALLDLCSAKIASLIKGKTPEQIRATFNIVNDFTPEEEEAVRQENKWAEEC